MKKFIYISIFSLFFASCNEHEALSELDEILDNKDFYEECFRHRTDSLKSSYSTCKDSSSRFKTAWQLCEEYKVYNIDTCLIYAQQMLDDARDLRDSIIAKSALVYSLASIGHVSEAMERLKEIPRDFTYDSELYIFYEAAHHLYFTLNQMSPDKRDTYKAARHKIRQDLLQYDTTSYIARTYLIHEKTFNKEYEQAFRVAVSILEKENLPTRYRAINEYNLANIYGHLGDEDKSIKHLINAAELDLKSATKEYNSLYQLAKILHRKGDHERASRYMLHTLNDAIFCNYKSHYLRSANASQTIYQIYLQELKLKKRRQTQLIIALLILLAASILLLIVRQVYSNKEKKAIERLRISNLRLKDNNKIRDIFLSKYMEKSAYYIEKVDDIKSDMRKTYRKEGLDALLKMLRSPAFADTEFKNYFQEFDNSIIKLYPTFVEDVNKLMKEDCRFAVKKNGTLCTELRILALIRMGITDSPKIAKVLNIAVYTAYCYRHRMRRDSLYSAEDFEKLIREIGLEE